MKRTDTLDPVDMHGDPELRRRMNARTAELQQIARDAGCLGWDCPGCTACTPAPRFSAEDDAAANAAAPSIDAPDRGNGSGSGRRTAGPTSKTNRYPGACRNCGHRVEVGEGHAVKTAGAWKVEHSTCPTGVAPIAPPADGPTEKQWALIERLRSERDTDGWDLADRADMTPAEASQHISILLAASRRMQTIDVDPGSRTHVAGGQVTAGMYRDPATGDIFKVQPGRQSGSLYAKRLDADRNTFDYVPGAIRRVRPEWRMTLDEARAFGQATGVCCCCGRTLTKPESIEAGIGPVCAGRV